MQNWCAREIAFPTWILARLGETRLRAPPMLLWIRRYAPPVHWIGAVFSGAAMYAYAWVTARTSRVVVVGEPVWPDVPRAGVLATWHDSAPTLLVALAKRKPSAKITIMVATEPRGDALTVLCRLLKVFIAG